VVLDHSPNILRLYKASLETRGYEVGACIQNIVTVDQLAAFNPDLIILDAIGIHSSELSLVYQIRNHRQLQFTPLIISTTSVPMVLNLDGVDRLPNVTLLSKPFAHQILLKCVREALQIAQK
jgi:DNA-binding response OmpR family regulator